MGEQPLIRCIGPWPLCKHPRNTCTATPAHQAKIALSQPMTQTPDVEAAVERLTALSVKYDTWGRAAFLGSFKEVAEGATDLRAILAPSPSVEKLVGALEEVRDLIKISPDTSADDFDRGARAARLQAFDIATEALAHAKGGE